MYLHVLPLSFVALWLVAIALAFGQGLATFRCWVASADKFSVKKKTNIEGVLLLLLFIFFILSFNTGNKLIAVLGVCLTAFGLSGIRKHFSLFLGAAPVPLILLLNTSATVATNIFVYVDAGLLASFFVTRVAYYHLGDPLNSAREAWGFVMLLSTRLFFQLAMTAPLFAALHIVVWGLYLSFLWFHFVQAKT